MRMATLQVKRLPDDVHQTLKHRAQEQGVSLSELVTRILRVEASVPALATWRRTLATRETSPDIDIEGLMDDVRADVTG